MNNIYTYIKSICIKYKKWWQINTRNELSFIFGGIIRGNVLLEEGIIPEIMVFLKTLVKYAHLEIHRGAAANPRIVAAGNNVSNLG